MVPDKFGSSDPEPDRKKIKKLSAKRKINILYYLKSWCSLLGDGGVFWSMEEV